MKPYRQSISIPQKLVLGVVTALVCSCSASVLAQDTEPFCFMITPAGETLHLNNICQQSNEQPSEMSPNLSSEDATLRIAASERATSEDYQGAIEAFTQILEMNPNDAASVFAARALVHNRMGNNQNAIEDLQQAAQLYQGQGDTISYQAMLRRIERLNSNE